MKYKSKCCRVKISKSSIGLIRNQGRYARLGVCPSCMSFCQTVEVERSSKIFHAALKLILSMYKGIITLDNKIKLILSHSTNDAHTRNRHR